MIFFKQAYSRLAKLGEPLAESNKLIEMGTTPINRRGLYGQHRERESSQHRFSADDQDSGFGALV
jgi:hypothetical protein